MTTLILDYSKWRCGGSGSGVNNGPDNEKGVGKGWTRLKNVEGYMCCLGQWICQRHPELEMPKEAVNPGDVGKEINFDSIFVQKSGYDNQFSTDAIAINDDGRTTVEEKIKKLTKLCKDHGYKLKVINAPAQ